MGKTGRTNNKYPDELRMRAVRLVTEENVSYREAAKELGIRNKSQVLVWVQRYREGQPLVQETAREGQPKTEFVSMEEEMAYLRAEIAYLKKRYPNLHGE